MDNLDYCFNKYGMSMNIITGDGGFDFSINFNKQEVLSKKLILCQIVYAIAMQKYNGHFIIKFFDIFTAFSIDLLFLLSNVYKTVTYMKPYTSRYANSEKYIVCKYFKLKKKKIYQN